MANGDAGEQNIDVALHCVGVQKGENDGVVHKCEEFAAVADVMLVLLLLFAEVVVAMFDVAAALELFRGIMERARVDGGGAMHGATDVDEGGGGGGGGMGELES